VKDGICTWRGRIPLDSRLYITVKTICYPPDWHINPIAWPKAGISQRTHQIYGRDALTASWESAHMTELDTLEQLRTDILDVFPPGPQRDVWLAWLVQLTTDVIGRCAAVQRMLH
jgi:hypothetical protein